MPEETLSYHKSVSEWFLMVENELPTRTHLYDKYVDNKNYFWKNIFDA